MKTCFVSLGPRDSQLIRAIIGDSFLSPRVSVLDSHALLDDASSQERDVAGIIRHSEARSVSPFHNSSTRKAETVQKYSGAKPLDILGNMHVDSTATESVTRNDHRG